jgi:hypothetical protein
MVAIVSSFDPFWVQRGVRRLAQLAQEGVRNGHVLSKILNLYAEKSNGYAFFGCKAELLDRTTLGQRWAPSHSIVQPWQRHGPALRFRLR